MRDSPVSTDTPRKAPTPLESTKLLLEGFELTDGSYVYSPWLSSTKVPVYADNAIDQVRLTNHLIYCLRNDARISSTLVEDKVRHIYLRDFFVDNNKNYDDVVVRTEELTQASLELITLFIEKENTQQTDTNTFHNRLVLGPITQAIIHYTRTVHIYGTTRRTGYQNGDSR